MDLKAFLLDTHQLLETAKIPHALIGGFAMAVLGYPRATNDVDYLVDGDYMEEAKAAFEKAGFSLFYHSPEVLQMQREHPVDILFAKRPHSKGMLSRALGRERFWGIPCLDAADIIGLKIQAYTNNPRRELGELADILKLVEVVGDLDRQRVLTYAAMFGEQERIGKLLKARDKE